MNHRPPAYYTLTDLLGHYDNGEMTLEEVIAHWPHDGKTNDELLRELLRALIGLYKRIRILES